MTSTATHQQLYRVVVIELDDLLPRLESGLPNLLVVATLRRPEDRLRDLNQPTGRNNQRRVYVIELDHSHLAGPVSGYFYVGETSRPPEVRFEQHRTDARSASGRRLAARGISPHVRRLRPDLAPTKFYLSKADAEAAEAATRRRLEAAGYQVRGAHTMTDDSQ